MYYTLTPQFNHRDSQQSPRAGRVGGCPANSRPAGRFPDEVEERAERGNHWPTVSGNRCWQLDLDRATDRDKTEIGQVWIVTGMVYQID